MKQVFENKSTSIAFDEANILHVAYKTRATNEEYIINLNTQVEFVKKHNVKKALFDLRKMGVITSENQKYTQEVYFPQLIAAGLKLCALIVPESIFGEVTAKNVSDNLKEIPVTITYFQDTKRALDWLLNS